MKIPSLFNNHLMKALLLGVLNYKKPLDYSRGHLKSMPDNEDAMCLVRHYSDFHRKKLKHAYKIQILVMNENLRDFIQKTLERLNIDYCYMDHWSNILRILTSEKDVELLLIKGLGIKEPQAKAFISLFKMYKEHNFIPARNHINYGPPAFDLATNFEGSKLWHVEEVKDQPLLEEVEYDNEAEAPFITTIFPEEKEDTNV